ncbi:MAG: cell division protein ZapA [Bacteroidales bacterium]|nr:cell division protein ZapA [Bacteroidales bacterium]
MDEKLSIKVSIDGHVFQMKVKRSDEEVIRKAAQLINERLLMYKQKFNVTDKNAFDFLAMVSLDLVTKYLNNEKTTDDTEFMSQLGDLSDEIDDYIQKSNVL